MLCSEDTEVPTHVPDGEIKPLGMVNERGEILIHLCSRWGYTLQCSSELGGITQPQDQQPTGCSPDQEAEASWVLEGCGGPRHLY